MSACPECDQPLTAEPPYPEWCSSCDWNVVRPGSSGVVAPRKARFARLQARLVRGLHEDVLRSHPTPPATADPFPTSGHLPASGHLPTTGHLPASGHFPATGRIPETGDVPEAGHLLEARHVTETGHLPENGHLPATGHIPETGHLPENGHLPATGHIPETGHTTDARHAPVTSHLREAAHVPEPGHATDQTHTSQDVATSGGVAAALDNNDPAASPGIARAAVYTLALLTHLLTPAFLLLGIYLLTRGSLFAILPALVALDLAWLLRPRAAPFPPDTRPLTRETAPHLFALLDRIGAEVGAPRTDVVAVSGEVNASSRTYGWRRRPVIEIGYPMWLILTPQERIGLLAHEMAHSSNGDSRHGFVVGSAYHSLAVLADVTRFDWREGDGLAGLVAESLLAVLGLPVRGLMVAMELLLYRSSQRAEYRADELGARVAGTSAMTSLLDATNTRAPSAISFLETSAHTAKPEHLWTALRTSVDAVPASELERRRRAARLEELRVDRTHPPTYLRMEWVAALPYTEGRVPIGDGPAIDKELETVALRVAQTIRENAESALYH
ncbi:M48 family metallopeptidase [Nonomuraea sp. NPDC050202]|uniref:M48 family metallopeptidase n=1 Tax=Nonomuraea sp. NPDC050202 TaxID=3155035 RepID=UPI003405BEAE